MNYIITIFFWLLGTSFLIGSLSTVFISPKETYKSTRKALKISAFIAFLIGLFFILIIPNKNKLDQIYHMDASKVERITLEVNDEESFTLLGKSKIVLDKKEEIEKFARECRKLKPFEQFSPTGFWRIEAIIKFKNKDIIALIVKKLRDNGYIYIIPYDGVAPFNEHSYNYDFEAFFMELFKKGNH
jgi:hypothetical protein